MGSWVRTSGLAAAVIVSSLAGSVGFAQDAAPQGDPVRGAPLGNTCLGCHGVPHYKNSFPNYSVPKLVGQHPEYIVIALKAYRTSERAHLTMHAQASSLSDQDMADVAAYLARAAITAPAPAEGAAAPAASGKMPESAQVCVACHGTEGVGIMGQYPTLSGQHKDYLVRALTDYKKGGRKNPIMATFAGQLNEQQIDELAEYFSKKRPALETFPKPASRWSGKTVQR